MLYVLNYCSASLVSGLRRSGSGLERYDSGQLAVALCIQLFPH